MGRRVAAFKPVVTGLAEGEPGRPADHALLGAAAGVAPEAVAPLRYSPAVSPHLAAEPTGTAIDPGALVAAARVAGLDVRAVVLAHWPGTPTAMQRSNRSTIARLGAVAVATLAPVGAGVGALDRAGAALPVGEWLGL